LVGVKASGVILANQKYRTNTLSARGPAWKINAA